MSNLNQQTINRGDVTSNSGDNVDDFTSKPQSDQVNEHWSTPETPWQPQRINKETGADEGVTIGTNVSGGSPSLPAIDIKPLTRKQTAFVKHLIENPKDSATSAAAATYNVKSRDVARMIGSENLAKPAIKLELAKHSAKAELVILEVLEQSRKEMYNDTKEAVQWANNARQTADSLLDRVHGKATQRTETTSQAVTLNIDLSGAVTPANNK